MDDETRQRLDDVTARLRRIEQAFEFWTPYLVLWQDIDWQKGAEVAALVSHTIICVVLVIAAVVVSLTGNDATLIWGLVGGYIGGSAVQKVTAAKAQ